MSPSTKPKRVLIYRLGSLGDTVVAIPALRLTARAFPDAQRVMLTTFPPNSKAPASSAVLEQMGLVHGYLRYTYGTRNVRDLVALWWRIVRWRPDTLVYMGGPRGVKVAKRDKLFFRLCGVQRQIGVPLLASQQSYLSLQGGDHEQEGGSFLEHECSRLLRCLSTLGTIPLNNPASWDLALTIGEHAKAQEVLSPIITEPFIAVSLGTKNQSNEWGLYNWTSLLVDLAKALPNYGLVLCGARVEREDCELIKSGWDQNARQPALNLCGLLSPRESAAVFARAALFVGHDSGPLHLAAAVQTPCVGIFSGRNQPRVWFPYGNQHSIIYHAVDCQGCGLQICHAQRKKCILSITAAEVLVRVMSQLGRSHLN